MFRNRVRHASLSNLHDHIGRDTMKVTVKGRVRSRRNIAEMVRARFEPQSRV